MPAAGGHQHRIGEHLVQVFLPPFLDHPHAVPYVVGVNRVALPVQEQQLMKQLDQHLYFRLAPADDDFVAPGNDAAGEIFADDAQILVAVAEDGYRFLGIGQFDPPFFCFRRQECSPPIACRY